MHPRDPWRSLMLAHYHRAIEEEQAGCSGVSRCAKPWHLASGGRQASGLFFAAADTVFPLDSLRMGPQYCPGNYLKATPGFFPRAFRTFASGHKPVKEA